MGGDPNIEVHQDFVQVYDLPDPRPYYRALKPADYRMPGVVADFIVGNASVLSEAFAQPRPRLLDFACGFGAAAALIRHGLTCTQLFEYYDQQVEAGIGDDAAFFAGHQRSGPSFEIGGLDIAANAIGYARNCGLIDQAFDDDTLSAAPGPGLAAYLAETALIYEAGATLDVLMPALLNLLDAATGAPSPWLLYSPRFDVDDRTFISELRTRDYLVEIVNREPIHYRRSLGAKERTAHEAAIRKLGRDPVLGFDGDYLILDMKFARPRSAVDAYPLSRFPFSG